MIKQGQGVPLGPECSRFAVLYSGQTLPPSVAFALGYPNAMEGRQCVLLFGTNVWCTAERPVRATGTRHTRAEWGWKGGGCFCSQARHTPEHVRQVFAALA